jgi:hypothetical protein
MFASRIAVSASLSSFAALSCVACSPEPLFFVRELAPVALTLDVDAPHVALTIEAALQTDAADCRAGSHLLRVDVSSTEAAPPVQASLTRLGEPQPPIAVDAGPAEGGVVEDSLNAAAILEGPRRRATFDLDVFAPCAETPCTARDRAVVRVSDAGALEERVGLEMSAFVLARFDGCQGRLDDDALNLSVIAVSAIPGVP